MTDVTIAVLNYHSGQVVTSTDGGFAVDTVLRTRWVAVVNMAITVSPRHIHMRRGNRPGKGLRMDADGLAHLIAINISLVDLLRAIFYICLFGMYAIHVQENRRLRKENEELRLVINMMEEKPKRKRIAGLHEHLGHARMNDDFDEPDIWGIDE